MIKINMKIETWESMTPTVGTLSMISLEVLIFILLGKTSVDKLLLEYMSKIK